MGVIRPSGYVGELGVKGEIGEWRISGDDVLPLLAVPLDGEDAVGG